MPPEAADGDDGLQLLAASGWDVATRYHEYKSRLGAQRAERDRLRRVSAEAILERAKAVLGSLVHPVEHRVSALADLPFDASQVELDLEETVDAGGEIHMGYRVHRKQSVVLAVDTSLSMTGEKLALTAVALAVVLLQFPDDPVGIVAFENEAVILKRPDEKVDLQKLLEQFLDVPAQGYTHLEDGMRVALGLVRGRASTVLLTDGKYTAGRDPSYLAPRFSHLVVLKMGRERASLELCRELAKKGSGSLREVAELESLPEAMYGVVKDLLRGRS